MRSAWSGREVLRLLRNPRYAGRMDDGAPAVHTAIVQPELFDRVQELITGRTTRANSSREREDFDQRFDPFILRGLIACSACGRTMTTSMSTKLTTKSAKNAPRYYRCRTHGCAAGQIAAREIEGMALEALGSLPASCDPEVRAKAERTASVWNDLWPVNRRRALAEIFESLTWQSRKEQLVFTVRAAVAEASP